MWHYLCDPTFSRFDTILECDRHTHTHTHRQTHDDGIYHASIASRGKNHLVDIQKILHNAASLWLSAASSPTNVLAQMGAHCIALLRFPGSNPDMVKFV